jgi:hypothetical protein
MESVRLRPIALFVCLAVVAFGHGCNENATGPGFYGEVTGTVVNGAGTPVPGAALCFGFRFETIHGMELWVDSTDDPGTCGSSVAKTRSPAASTRIVFEVPHDGFVSLLLRDYGGTRVRTLFEGTLVTGTYAVEFDTKDDDGRTLYNDVYRFEERLDGEVILSRKLLFAGIDQYLCPNPRFYALTDGNGRFRIPRERLPFGEIFPVTGGTPEPYDTARFSTRQSLYAFTEAMYGRVDFSIISAQNIVIKLDHGKSPR